MRALREIISDSRSVSCIDAVEIQTVGEELRIHVSGWFFFRDGSAKEPVARIGGAEYPCRSVYTARSDVAALYHREELPEGSGFSLELTCPSQISDRELCISFSGAGKQSAEILRGVICEMGEICGSLDEITVKGGSTAEITGWKLGLRFLDRQYARAEIRIQEDNGDPVSFERTDMVRSDVNRICYPEDPDAKSGFHLTFPVKEGKKYRLIFASGIFSEETVIETEELFVLARERERHYRNRLDMLLHADPMQRKDDAYLKKKYGKERFREFEQKRLEPLDPIYMKYVQQNRVSPEMLEKQRRTTLPWRGTFSVIVPVYRTPVKMLKEMIESVRQQTFDGWELVIADGSAAEGDTQKLLKKYAAKDPRIHVTFLEDNLGIAGNTNAALRIARGDYIVLLDHDDVLTPDALFAVASVIGEDGGADIVYSDEDKFSDGADDYYSPAFKSDFNLTLLRSTNYICHLFCVRKTIAEEVGGFRKNFDGSQDYDLILRCVERASVIRHIPRVLYHWRCHAGSTAGNAGNKSYASEAGRRALEEHLQRCQVSASVSGVQDLAGYYRVDYALEGSPRLSIVTAEQDEKVLEAIQKKAGWEQLELVTSPMEASGDYLLFLDDGLVPETDGFAKIMLAECSQPSVGAVGVKILDHTRYIVHAGMVLGLQGMAGYILRGQPGETAGYQAKALLQQECSAVSGRCLMISRRCLEETGGFDPALPAYGYADLDLCLKLKKAGYRIVLDPGVIFCEREQTAAAQKDPEAERYLLDKWGAEQFCEDPFYNINLSQKENNFEFRIR